MEGTTWFLEDERLTQRLCINHIRKADTAWFPRRFRCPLYRVHCYFDGGFDKELASLFVSLSGLSSLAESCNHLNCVAPYFAFQLCIFVSVT
jgi:hypothetical protein